MASANNRFQKGSGVYTCSNCGKKTRETGGCESNNGLCIDCYDSAGIENEHYDGYHRDNPVSNCALCKAEKSN